MNKKPYRRNTKYMSLENLELKFVQKDATMEVQALG